MFLDRSNRATLSALGLLLAAFAPAQTLRVGAWNVSEFTGTNRLSDLQIVLFNKGPAGKMDPDILAAEEVQSPSAATAFLGALNASEPNTWAVTYGSLTGTSSTSDTCMFYKTARVSPAGPPVLVAPAGGTSGQPRDTWRFDYHIVGDNDTNEIISVYVVHMKAGSTSTDVTRRNIESQHIRTDSDALASNYRFMVAGDMNMQASTQSAYQTLITAGANASGQFYDPISTPGTWNLNSSFRFVHTQDPAGNGGMNDRHDQILVCHALVDGAGTDYVGAYGTPYSTTTWNDPNQSYRCWGNDGTSFNMNLTVAGNQMVGATIAQSIINAATPTPSSPGGHCPVFLDLRYVARIPLSGNVVLQNFSGAVAGRQATVQIMPTGTSNVLDTQTVTLDASGNFSLTTTVPFGSYDIAVKCNHWLRKKVTAVSLGVPGASGLSFSLTNGDVNGDNVISLGDFTALRAAFGSTSGDPNWNPLADLNGDGAVSLSDFTILRANFGGQGD
jgi:hypothetical protein